jgi:hypothetical protein
MRRFAIVLLAAVSLAACSSSIPRLPAVYVPPAAPTDAPVDVSTPTGADPTASTASAAPAPSVDTSAWGKLEVTGEVFTVLMPGHPTANTSTVKTDVGNASITTWSYSDSSKRSFAVTRARFAGGALSSATAKTIFDTATSTSLTNLKGATVTSQSDTTLGKYPARLVKFGNADASVVCEFVIVGDDVIGVSVGAPAGMADDGLQAAFFASLQITA